jgi:uncharacterized protein (DUF488 family)
MHAPESEQGMANRTLNEPVVVMTIGHSNRPLETFLQFLKSHGVKQLVDVRTIPRSRHNPQFNKETLPQVLRGAGIGYRHLPGLGGLRRARRDSTNMGWSSPSFRGYADYMQTAEFEEGLKTLIGLAKKTRLVVMCAEAVPWRCHRSLISDALVVRGVQVEHIMTQILHHSHKLTPFANIKGERITYPPEQANPFLEPGNE